jgi:hypothetical protein
VFNHPPVVWCGVVSDGAWWGWQAAAVDKINKPMDNMTLNECATLLALPDPRPWSGRAWHFTSLIYCAQGTECQAPLSWRAGQRELKVPAGARGIHANKPYLMRDSILEQ